MNLTWCRTGNSSHYCYNYNDDVLNDIQTKFFPLILTFLLVLLGLLLVIIFRKLFFELRRKEAPNKQNLGEIPIFSTLPLGIGLRLPAIIETVILAAQIKREGVKLMERIYQQYIDEPIVKIPLLTNHILQIKCPLMIQKILASSNQHVLNKPQQFYKHAFPEEYNKGLVTSSIEIWTPHRKILNKCWNYSAILSFLGIMNKHGRNLIKDLLHQASSNSSAALEAPFVNSKLYFHALNIISEILMGEGVFTEEENKSFHAHFVAEHSITVYRILNPHNLIPLVWWLKPKRKTLKYHTSELRKHVSKAIHHVKEEIQIKSQIRKVHSNRNATPERLRTIVEELINNDVPEDDIQIEVFTSLVAGHETTVGSIQFFLQHIAENRNIQRLCQEEVDSVFDSKNLNSGLSQESFNGGKYKLTLTDLANLKYLERCILETLRFAPVLPTIYRHLSAPMEINGYKFKKDSVIGIPIWGIHRDPKHFPNPEKFDPDRFLPENIAKRSPYTFLPFSHGPRNCIGNKAAMMEMKIILAQILHHFDVSTSDRFKEVPIRFELKISPERDYNITLTKRK